MHLLLMGDVCLPLHLYQSQRSCMLRTGKHCTPFGRCMVQLKCSRRCLLWMHCCPMVPAGQAGYMHVFFYNHAC